jgi:rubredoxin
VLQEYDWHPLFTGRCPVCHKPFSRLKLPPLHWRCSSCGWEDDTF